MITIHLTDSLANRIKALQASEKKPGLMLRVAVLGGGCSGFQYQFSFADDLESGDMSFEKNGTTVVIDEISLPFLDGATIDYAEDLIGASFRIDNPNAESSCGCGTSFAVKT